MMIRLRYWPFLCLLGLALASPAHPAKAQDGKRGIYVALTGMYVIPRDSERTVQHEVGTASTDLTFEDGRGILGALGYSFGSGLRAEVEIGYRRAEVDELERFGRRWPGLHYQRPCSTASSTSRQGSCGRMSAAVSESLTTRWISKRR